MSFKGENGAFCQEDNKVSRWTNCRNAVQIVTFLSWSFELLRALLNLLQQKENVLGVRSREVTEKTYRNFRFTTVTDALLRTKAFWGVSQRLWVNVSKYSERSGLLYRADVDIEHPTRKAVKIYSNLQAGIVCGCSLTGLQLQRRSPMI